MKHRNGRQKFHDIRLLTFQDWILPRYNNHHRKAEEMMKNNRLPVFSYTKMDNGSPLSPISSQFAWAGHTLPDLVQEQSNRLLRRLERPRTADNNRISIYKNNQMRGGKISRPSTAAPTQSRTSVATTFRVKGTKFDGPLPNEIAYVPAENSVMMAAQTEAPVLDSVKDNSSPVSDRSSSPDFMANLYKEYEQKMASYHCNEVFSPSSESVSPTSPGPKLLRRPSIQFCSDKRTTRRKSSGSQTVPVTQEKVVHCVVKLPSDQGNFLELSMNNIRSKSEPPKSETWLDLSELCQSSDEEVIPNPLPDGLRVPRPSLASESGSSLRILDLLSECDDGENLPENESKKLKSKLPRPCSTSKNAKKVRPKSRLKKRRPHSVSFLEESTKEAPRKPIRNGRGTDKLREEIETQMSKLDFDNTARSDSQRSSKGPSTNGLSPRRVQKSGVPQATSIVTNSVKPSTCDFNDTSTLTDSFFSSKSSLPLKKVPIQILSDPFSSKLKVYHKGS